MDDGFMMFDGWVLHRASASKERGPTVRGERLSLSCLCLCVQKQRRCLADGGGFREYRNGVGADLSPQTHGRGLRQGTITATRIPSR